MAGDLPNTPFGLWRAALAADPARPFITAYGGPGGSDRVELSYATVDNWVCKTANLLVDEIGAEPGDRVVLALPVHWQSLVWLLACWATSTVAVPEGSGGLPEGEIAVVGPDRLDAAPDTGAHEVVAASLHPLGAPLPDCPPTVLDYATAARGHGDHYSPAAPVDPGDTALLLPEGGESGAELADRARAQAAAWGLSSSDRVAVPAEDGEPLTAPRSDLGWFLAPLASGAALVLTPATDSGSLPPRLAMEHVSAIVGPAFGPLPQSAEIRPLT